MQSKRHMVVFFVCIRALEAVFFWHGLDFKKSGRPNLETKGGIGL